MRWQERFEVACTPQTERRKRPHRATAARRRLQSQYNDARVNFRARIARCRMAAVLRVAG